jgi:hypothetical protein
VKAYVEAVGQENVVEKSVADILVKSTPSADRDTYQDVNIVSAKK